MSAMDAFWAAPPVTRTIAAASLALSVSVWLIPVISPYYVVFVPQTVFTYRRLPQLWRLVTPFLLTGQGLGMILDPYFLYTHGSQLETGSPRFQPPGEFFTFIVFVAAFILLTAGYLLGAFVLLSPLTLAFAYMSAIDNPESRVSLFIVTVRGKYLPYAMLAMTLLVAGPTAALHQSTGLLAGHAYDFLTRLWPRYGGGRVLITAPAVVKRWFLQPGMRSTQRTYGTSFDARARPAPAQPAVGRSWTSGFSGGTWGGRGPGHRLGGD